MTFVEVKFECINWWGNEVYRTKNDTPILRLPEDGWFSIADPSDIDGEPCSKLKAECIKIVEELLLSCDYNIKWEQVSCLKGIRLEDVTPELDSKAYVELKNNKH